MFREPQEQYKIGGGFSNYLYCLECGELKCLFFLSEFGEKYGRDGIKCQDSANIFDA